MRPMGPVGNRATIASSISDLANRAAQIGGYFAGDMHLDTTVYIESF